MRLPIWALVLAGLVIVLVSVGGTLYGTDNLDISFGSDSYTTSAKRVPSSLQLPPYSPNPAGKTGPQISWEDAETLARRFAKGPSTYECATENAAETMDGIAKRTGFNINGGSVEVLSIPKGVIRTEITSTDFWYPGAGYTPETHTEMFSIHLTYNGTKFCPNRITR